MLPRKIFFASPSSNSIAYQLKPIVISALVSPFAKARSLPAMNIHAKKQSLIHCAPNPPNKKKGNICPGNICSSAVLPTKRVICSAAKFSFLEEKKLNSKLFRQNGSQPVSRRHVGKFFKQLKFHPRIWEGSKIYTATTTTTIKKCERKIFFFHTSAQNWQDVCFVHPRERARILLIFARARQMQWWWEDAACGIVWWTREGSGSSSSNEITYIFHACEEKLCPFASFSSPPPSKNEKMGNYLTASSGKQKLVLVDFFVGRFFSPHMGKFLTIIKAMSSGNVLLLMGRGDKKLCDNLPI